MEAVIKIQHDGSKFFYTLVADPKGMSKKQVKLLDLLVADVIAIVKQLNTELKK